MCINEGIDLAVQGTSIIVSWIMENIPDLVREHPEILEKIPTDDKVWRSDYVADQVIANLIAAHRRVCHTGSALEVIELSRYLIEVSREVRDVLVDVISEEE